MIDKLWTGDETLELTWELWTHPQVIGVFMVLIACLFASSAVITNTFDASRSRSQRSVASSRKRVSLSPAQWIRQFMEGGVLSAWTNFWRKLPHRIFSFFIEALLIPPYRHEWGNYRTWNYRSQERKQNTYSYRHMRLEAQKYVVDLIKLYLPKKPMPIKHDHQLCKRIRINVTGMIYETQLRTLAKFPDTLLGDPDRRIQFYDPINDWYFFDRNRHSFEAVLYFYQSGGRFRRPENIHVDVFLDDAEFYQLPAAVIQKYRVEEGLLKDSVDENVPASLYLRKIWLLFDLPESGPQARILAMISIFVVIISIIIFCIETLPALAGRSETTIVGGVTQNHPFDGLDIGDPFFFTETVCTIWFTLELAARLISCPSKVHFLTSPLNLIDFMAVIPYFLTIATAKGPRANSDSKVDNTAYLSILRVIRLVRVFRIFKLSRHSTGLKILGRTLHASLSELCLLIFFVFIGIILFSSTMYFCELGEPNTNFTSIPDGFWWAVITMTTVGFGDVVPRTVFGKLVGSLCAIAGVLTIALPVPVIVSNFNYFYHQTLDQQEFNWARINYVSVCPYRPGGFAPQDSKSKDISDIPYSDSSDEFEELKYNPLKAKTKEIKKNK